MDTSKLYVYITRFRTGSNNLLIETGRFATPRIPRENRMCLCGTEVQTLRHVLMYCPIVRRNNGGGGGGDKTLIQIIYGLIVSFVYMIRLA